MIERELLALPNASYEVWSIDFVMDAHARAVIMAWRQNYDEQRPYSVLNYLSQVEFVAKHRATADAPGAFRELV